MQPHDFPPHYTQAPTWRIQVEWLPIPGTTYEASILGAIRHVKRKHILSPALDKDGYPYVRIKQNGRFRTPHVHRLVLLAFIGKPPTPQHQAAHADGCRSHNAIWNLRWATPKENAADRIQHKAMREAKLDAANDNLREANDTAA